MADPKEITTAIRELRDVAIEKLKQLDVARSEQIAKLTAQVTELIDASRAVRSDCRWDVVVGKKREWVWENHAWRYK